MMNNLSENEKTILSNALAGNFHPFHILRNQIDRLSVKSRRKAYHVYQAEFDFEGNQRDVFSGHEENIQIEDTYFQVHESSVPFYVMVKVVGGVIRWLQVGADFDFGKEFSLKYFYWENRNVDPTKKGDVVHDADERDFRRAISYTATYR